MPDVNVPLLRKTLEHITAHPEEWDQSAWGRLTHCGTVACLAGTAVQLDGQELNFNMEMCSCSICRYDGTIAQATYVVGGESICTAATRALGLTGAQADHLFSGANDLRDLWRLAEEFTDGEIATPADLP